MEQALIDAYDKARDFSEKPFRSACYAPFLSMVFDSIGRVRACCANFEHILGDIRTQRIDAIWNGEPIERLRTALKRYDFSHGCGYCYFKIAEGSFDGKNFSNTLLQTYKYEEYPVEPEAPYLPKHLEFHMSNVCNLECVMCSGEFSSAIRSRREKLPPYKKAYTDQFFEDLRKYLPALKNANFLGGEPFLIREQFRVWDMLIEQGLKPNCHITTNGTQYNDKVARILENLPIHITVSMDGVTKPTFETIRKNAIWEEVLENLQHFYDYLRPRGRRLCFSFTLSRLNWHEFGDFLLFADDWEGFVSVSTLFTPPAMSLHTLSANELAEVVATMEKQGETILPKLTLNKQVWINYLKELHYRLNHIEEEVFGDRADQEVVQITVAAIEEAPPAETDTRPMPEDPVEVTFAPQVPEPEDEGQQDPTPADHAAFAEPESPPEVPSEPPDVAARNTSPTKLVDYFEERPDGIGHPDAREEEVRAWLVEWSGGGGVDVLICDRDDAIVGQHLSGRHFLDVERDCVGEPTDTMFALLRDRYGARVETVSAEILPDRVDRVVSFQDGEREPALVRSVTLPRFDPDGRLLGTVTLAAARHGLSLAPAS